MGLFGRLARFIVLALIFMLIVRFFLDVMLIQIYKEDARVESYLAGEFVSKISADEGGLSVGEIGVVSPEKIMEEFERYADAVYLPRASKKDKNTSSCGGFKKCTWLRYQTDSFGINGIVIGGRLWESGGWDILEVTIYRELVPRASTLGFVRKGVDGNIESLLPNYHVGLLRNYRLGLN